MSRRLLVLVVALVALAAGAGWLGLGSGPQPPPAPAARASAPVAAPGVVEPLDEERDVAAEIKGKIKAVRVQEGQWIEIGTVVAELENDDLLARMQAAQAVVDQRTAELERLRAGARPQERRVAAADLAATAAVLAQAEADFARRATLVERGAASREQLDAAHAQRDSALARRNAAAERVSLIEAPPRVEDVRIAEANLALARAQAAEARALYDKTFVKTPIAGRVLQRLRRDGEAVTDTPPTVIVKVGDTARLNVRVEIDEVDVAKVAVGQRVHLTADAYPDQRFAGTITRVGERLGRKRLTTDLPTEKVDTRVLECLVRLDPGIRLPLGLRVDVFVAVHGS